MLTTLNGLFADSCALSAQLPLPGAKKTDEQPRAQRAQTAEMAKRLQGVNAAQTKLGEASAESDWLRAEVNCRLCAERQAG